MYSFSATHAAARRAKAWRREGGEGKGVKVGQSREVGDGIGQPKDVRGGVGRVHTLMEGLRSMEAVQSVIDS